MLGAHFAGMAIENAMLGVCHSCANPLTAHYGMTHGTAIGLMLPHVIRFNAAGRRPALRRPDRRTPGCPTASRRRTCWPAGWRRCCTPPGCRQSLKDCGVSETILPLLAEEANQQWTARFNPRPVAEADIARIYQAAW